ncbi:DUF5615 family PIN-like protein [Chloroflexi bacterium TSY]|nr:DUF5615 family PIN-like protein [Chloroflexi bacterium TSY]
MSQLSSQIIVKAFLRREPSIDFQTAHAANLAGVDDIAVLTLAANEGRLLVTHDRRTMPIHFGNFIMNNTSAGVLIVSRRLSISSVVEDLLTIWVASEAEEWTNRILSLPL